MSTRVEATLAQLAATFTVRDIMVAVDGMTRANSPEEAERVLEEHPDYDHIPLPASGEVTGYVRRGDSRSQRVRPVDLISDGTSMLDVPDLMAQRDFFFVLSSNHIRGFLHFSDLNNELVKLPFFVLFETIERRLTSQLEPRMTDDALEEVVTDRQRLDAVRQRLARAQARRANRNVVDFLYFDEILRFAAHWRVIELAAEDREILADVRNRVAHSSRELVEEHGDLRLLVRARQIGASLLGLEL